MESGYIHSGFNIYYKEARLIRRLILCAVVCAGALPVRADDGKGYDVSYLWHGDFSQVLRYRDSVLRVLGPHMRPNILIVRGRSLYGLIYDRNGDAESTRELAERHARLLVDSGLEKSVMVRSDAWPVVSSLRSAVAEPKEGLRRPDLPPPILKRQRTPSRGALSGLPDLEKKIGAYIQDRRRAGLIQEDEDTSWSVYDFTTGEKLADINEDKPMQAASLVKPFFALAFFHQVRAGKLQYGPKSRRMMRLMIQKSNNSATNWILRRVGGPEAVEQLLRESYGSIFRDTKIVEYIPWGGRTYRNKSTVHDYSRFLYALWHADIPGSAEIKRLMSLPNKDRLSTGAKDIPKGIKVYDKTGSTKHLCGNMGILEVRGPYGKKYAYALIGVIEKEQPAENYTNWITSRGDVIREVSNIVYKEMETRHGF